MENHTNNNQPINDLGDDNQQINDNEVFYPIPNSCGYSINKNGQIKNSNGLIMKIATSVEGYKHCNIVYDLPEGKKKKTSYIHRILAELFIDNPDPMNRKYIDHIDKNPQNNSIDNLRWVPNGENQLNKKLQSNNKTGYKGVSFNFKRCKYVAYYRGRNLGYRETALECSQLYENALKAEYPHLVVAK